MHLPNFVFCGMCAHACMCVCTCQWACSNTHLASQSATARKSIWASRRCVLQGDNPPLPRPLPPAAHNPGYPTPSSPLRGSPHKCQRHRCVAASCGDMPSSHVPLSTNAQSAEEAQKPQLLPACPRLSSDLEVNAMQVLAEKLA